jgi:Wzt C-terminal domain
MTIDKPFPGRIIFDHLPKTAGQAINAWLEEVLGSGCITSNLIGNHLDLIRQYGGLYSIISAHVLYTGEGFDPRYQYMTFFREPVDRAVSWLYFVINNHDDDSNLKELRESARRYLESDGEVFSDTLIVHLRNVYVEHFCRINGIGLGSDDEKLANALAAIKQYNVVGVYEEMPRFLADVAALIGLPPPQKIARINVTKQRPQFDQISPALRERIMALNQLDLRLFAEVVAWKASAIQSEASRALPLTESKWKKYEAVPDRVVITPDLAILMAVLRGGNNIRHGQLMTFDVDIFLAREVRDLEMGIHFFDTYRQCVFSINRTLLGLLHQSLPSGSYRVSFHLIADLPAGNYTAGFTFAEHLPEGLLELAWHDVMCKFQVYHQVKTFAGYCYLPSEISLCPTRLALGKMVVSQPIGSMVAVMPVTSMIYGEQANIGVTIVNSSEQVWVGNSFHPVNLSYHWLNDSGEMLVFDGMRTPLPAGGIDPGRSLNAEMLVEAPHKAGTYILVLSLVKESIWWFEDQGFEPARLTVEVMAPLSGDKVDPSS